MQLSYEMQINKLVNLLMKGGKKNKAKKILFQALYYIKKKTKKNPLYILKKALANSIPVVTYTPQKRGSKLFNIPSAVKHKRAVYLAAHWIIMGAQSRRSVTFLPGVNLKNNFAMKLCDELVDDSNGIGDAVRKKEHLYSIVIENRPFIRY